jgi:hypothetical protein
MSNVDVAGHAGQPPTISTTDRDDTGRGPQHRVLDELRRRHAGVALAGYLLGALWLTNDLWSNLTGVRIAGNPGDINLYQWWFGWWPHALSSGVDPFITDLMNMPVGVSLMANTSMAFPALATSWLFASAGPLATYNILSTLAPALTGFFFYSCARRMEIGAPAAFVGGLVFGFSPAIVHSLIGHLSMAMAMLLPVLVLLNVWAWTTSRPRRTGITLGLAAFVQTMTGEEVLFQAGVATLVAFVVVAVSRPGLVRSGLSTVARTYAWAFLVYIPLAGYPLYVQFLGPLKQHGSPFWIDYFAADLAAFTTAPELVWHGPGSGVDRFPAGLPEHLAYLGWPLIIFCVWTIVRHWDDLRVRVAGVGLAFSAVLSMGGTLWVRGHQTEQKLPYAWLENLPVISSALPSRYGLLAAMFAATLLTVGLDSAIRHGSPQPVRVGAVLLCALVLLTLAPKPLPVEPVPDIPRYFTSQARDLPAGTRALIVPFPRPAQTEPLRWQVAAGYSYAAPGGYFIAPGSDGHAYIGGAAGTLQQLLVEVEEKGQPVVVTGELRTAVAAELSGWDIDMAILGPGPRHPELRALLTELFGAPPREVEGVLIWDRPTTN